MRIIFLGTPSFALPSLQKLCDSRHEILAVITQPDKPAGRGNKLLASPVKKFALEHGLKLFQFEKVSRDGVKDIKELHPDIMITAAYGQILSQELLDVPKFGIINVHASLLPKYRGASPIQSAIIAGEAQTGVTIMQTEARLDTGDILSKVVTDIDPQETAGELGERLAELGSSLLLETLDKIENGTIAPEKQQHADATITNKITKEECIINFNRSNKQVRCLIHGANPDPVARTVLNGEFVKVYRARETDMEDTGKAPGTIVEPTSPKNGVFVQCGHGVIEFLEAQFAGGKVLDAKALVGGRKFAVGMQFAPVSFPSEHQQSEHLFK